MNRNDITPEMCLLAMDGCQKTSTMTAARRFIEVTRIIPDWFYEHFDNAERGLYKFGITHRGQHYERYAASAADAKNHLRFALYGERPERDCEPFEVVQFFPTMQETVDAFLATQKRLATCQHRAGSLSFDNVRSRLARLTA